ncbi:MAG TPA: redoxin domain-containing protein [Vicinamibacterales bacterium]|nr:redoxin domain-containing protein [Vicinamibacterales bacterium]
MEAYRDQYATLFNGGRNVVAIAVSVDADTTLASWARDLRTPILFGSDPDQIVGKRYAAAMATRKFNARHVYVIAPDGRIAHRMVPFNELSADAYTQLEQAVDKVSSGS